MHASERAVRDRGSLRLAIALLTIQLLWPGAALQAQLVCGGDPSRTTFAGGSGTGDDRPPGACRQFDGNQTICNQAFHLGNDGIASCYYDGEEDECRGCGPGENELDGDCTNTCAGTPTCAGDPTRTIFVGGPGVGEDPGACHTFDGDQASCLQAFHRNTVGGFSSCYWTGSDCQGCGPANESEGNCNNTCATSPVCQQDPGRTIFVGGPGTEACRQFNEDSASCAQAYHLGGDNLYTSCFPALECRRCESDRRKAEAPGGDGGRAQGGSSGDPPCTNACVPACADQTRTAYLGGNGDGACRVFDGNQTACLTGYHSGGKGVASCWYNASNDTCLGCGPSNEGGSCTNTCAPATCPARTTFLTGFQACQALDNDQTGCENAFHRTDNGQFASCFYDTNSGECRGCGPNHLAFGDCTNACGGAAPCAGDPSRTIIAGSSPGASFACRQFDGDSASCNQAYHVADSGDFASCFYDAVSDECRGCGPSNLNDGLCANTCLTAPTCASTGRTLGDCDNFDGDAAACNNAFELTNRGSWSCIARPRCLGCGLFNQSEEDCTNTCVEGPTGSEDGLCDDGLDNDGDQAVDCADSDCFGDTACPAPAPALSWAGLLLGLLAISGIALYRLRYRAR